MPQTRTKRRRPQTAGTSSPQPDGCGSPVRSPLALSAGERAVLGVLLRRAEGGGSEPLTVPLGEVAEAAGLPTEDACEVGALLRLLVGRVVEWRSPQSRTIAPLLAEVTVDGPDCRFVLSPALRRRLSPDEAEGASLRPRLVEFGLTEDQIERILGLPPEVVERNLAYVEGELARGREIGASRGVHLPGHRGRLGRERRGRPPEARRRPAGGRRPRGGDQERRLPTPSARSQPGCAAGRGRRGAEARRARSGAHRRREGRPRRRGGPAATGSSVLGRRCGRARPGVGGRGRPRTHRERGAHGRAPRRDGRLAPAGRARRPSSACLRSLAAAPRTDPTHRHRTRRRRRASPAFPLLGVWDLADASPRSSATATRAPSGSGPTAGTWRSRGTRSSPAATSPNRPSSRAGPGSSSSSARRSTTAARTARGSRPTCRWRRALRPPSSRSSPASATASPSARGSTSGGRSSAPPSTSYAVRSHD